LFRKIQEAYLTAIGRRADLDERALAITFDSPVSVDEFKEIDWATSEELLVLRLAKIRQLQMEAAAKFDEENRELIWQRIEKRRHVKESELQSASPKQFERHVLSNVLKAFSSALDGHTSYFTPGEATQFMIQVQQRLFGIGAQLRDDLNGFTVVKVLDGGPASQNTGLLDGDRIIAIDEEPVVGYEITAAVELIRGEEGTVVNLTVLRGEEEEKFIIPITRGEVVIQEARIESHSYPFGDGVIAHIALHAFYQDPVHSSCSDIYEHLEKIKKEGRIKGLVLDLRSNSGGVLPQAVAVTGLFISKGIVCSVKDNLGQVEHLRDIDGKIAFDGPLIVLISKVSASAAEIVAQTLQDYGRAIVVGDEHSYGKGTFQTFTLDAASNGRVNPKGEYKVTRGRYYTVSGRSPQLVGVASDVVVPGPFSALEIGEKYTKYPLENDSISENFDDDLSDIPARQRDQISWLYRYNLQPRLKSYTRFLPKLQENSKRRIEENKFYQSFLEILEHNEPSSDKIELFSKGDPQLHEALNITKDLILLLQ
ncbi:MAG: S41 family peptidase, partial [Chlamydiae bacterium]|nr:S41 family peptidase [Chlamydiota bacterium]